MQKINGTDIELTRGDTLMFTVRMTGRTVPQGTTAEFTVKKSFREEPVLEKQFSVEDSKAVIRLDPDETKGMDIRTYFWDLRLICENGDVETPMEYGTFTLVQNVGDGEV